MKRMFAYCGLVCSECPAYLATQAGDMAALEEVAARWSQEYGGSITAAYCLCDGCTSGSERLCGHCGECEVRACAIARGVSTCAHCDDYGCQTITRFLEFAPEAKVGLEKVRAGL
ncbi:MAG: DUF3795 domain-containing protein [Anaerolineales bacterium]|nr:MAG: DUF3795 domain-containing protein [Anaerolineales bacterium]